jgi:hypothetical protein
VHGPAHRRVFWICVAAEIEDDFSLLVADIASRLLKREIELVVVLPKVLQ